MQRLQRQIERQNEHGSVLLLTLIVLMLLIALAGGTLAVAQKNIKQSTYFGLQSDLHQYAQSGLALAAHDLDTLLGEEEGNIGTANWDSKADDVGRDGMAATLDEGEGDGLPTPGEPNLDPVPIGPESLGAQLLVAVYPTAYTGMFRIVSTCFTNGTSVSVETVYRNHWEQFSLPSPVFVTPDTLVAFADETAPVMSDTLVASADQTEPTLASTTDTKDATSSPTYVTSSGLTLDASDATLASASTVETTTVDPVASDSLAYHFNIDGNDQSGLGEPLYGLTTSVGDVPGDNAFALVSQMPTEAAERVQGRDGHASVGEVEGIDFSGVFGTLRGKVLYDYLANGVLLEPGSYDQLHLGLADSIAVTLVEGDLDLHGSSAGSGVLIVNGDLSIQGEFKYEGMVLVRGSVRLDGAGSGIQIRGGLLVDGARITILGQTEILYDSVVVEFLQHKKASIRSYSPLFYQEHSVGDDQ